MYRHSLVSLNYVFSWDIYLEYANHALSESFIGFIYNSFSCRRYPHNSILSLRW